MHIVLPNFLQGASLSFKRRHRGKIEEFDGGGKPKVQVHLQKLPQLCEERQAPTTKYQEWFAIR